jgi:hypothetical protein
MQQQNARATLISSKMGNEDRIYFGLQVIILKIDSPLAFRAGPGPRPSGFVDQSG